MDWGAVERAWLAGKAASTRGMYRLALRDFVAWAQVEPEAVTAGQAVDWARHLVDEGLSARTVNARLAAMSGLYTAAADLGWREGDPFAAVQRLAIAPAPMLELGELEAILSQISVECTTGLRDLALMYGVLVTCRRAAAWLGLRGAELAELPQSVRVMVEAYLDMADRLPLGSHESVFAPLFPDRARRLPGNGGVACDGCISVSFANRIVKKYARRAGVELAKANLEGLRRVGRWMARRGIALEVDLS